MYVTSFDSPLGKLTLYSNGTAITAVTMPVWRYTPPAGSVENEALPVFVEAKKWLENYFTGKESQPTVPLLPSGTDFQRQVWQILRDIPRGSTLTYGEIARMLASRQGRPTSPRAVGNAVGRNPIAIFIPCHRILGTGSSLTGFGGGLDAKRFLLDLEGIPYRESSAGQTR